MSNQTLKWNSEITFLATDPPDSDWIILLIEKIEIPPRSELYTMLPIGPGCSTGLFEMNDSLYQSSIFECLRCKVACATSARGNSC